MKQFERPMAVYADGEAFAPGARFRIEGKTAIGLFPSLFLLTCRNLREADYLRLERTREISVTREESRVAYGMVSDVFRETIAEGTITTAAFSLGLDLWESVISVSVEGGTTVSETVRRLLEASGTGIPLLSWPGEDPAVSRGQAYFGRGAECVETALNKAGARGYLTAAGICVVPKEALPVRLRLTEKDLADAPAFADGGRKVILRTTVSGFQPGEEAEVEYGRRVIRGMILERRIEADNADGPWRTELLMEARI